jgi:hypothetical protein
MDGDNGCMTMWMYSMPVNHTFKIVTTVNCIMYILKHTHTHTHTHTHIHTHTKAGTWNPNWNQAMGRKKNP